MCVVLVFSQARNLVLGNTSFVNVTVTEVATVETTNSNQIVVIFVIEFTANTTLVENFPTAISIPSMSLKYVQAVIPAGMCLLCVLCILHIFNIVRTFIISLKCSCCSHLVFNNHVFHFIEFLSN